MQIEFNNFVTIKIYVYATSYIISVNALYNSPKMHYIKKKKKNAE